LDPDKYFATAFKGLSDLRQLDSLLTSLLPQTILGILDDQDRGAPTLSDATQARTIALLAQFSATGFETTPYSGMGSPGSFVPPPEQHITSLAVGHL
jgi:hypothetical protein